MKPDESIINKTLNCWQPKSKADLQPEDARQIIENIAGYFAILNEWDQKARKVAENE